MHRTPLCIYTNVMSMLKKYQEQKIFVDLSYLADMIDYCGLSYTVAVDEFGSVSLPYALGAIFGLSGVPECDDFYLIVESIPASYRKRFIYCWEALEAEVGDDLVVWSEAAGLSETVATIRALSKTIEFA